MNSFASPILALLGYALCAAVSELVQGVHEENPLPKLEWTFQCGSPVYSCPVAAELTPSPGLEILCVSSSGRRVICLSASGQPLWTYGDFTLRVTSTPTLADLNADGKPEILIATRTDGVLCLSPDGGLVWKCPTLGGIPWGSATVADADHNGHPNIYWSTQPGWVECHASDGDALWSFQIESGGGYGSLAVGDLDGDEIDEIVACGAGEVCCLNQNGKQVWRFEGEASFNASPVVANLLHDKKPEVLAASNDGILYCLAGVNGRPLWTHRTFHCRIDSSIAVGDIDSDGSGEVFYGDGLGNLYCLASDGAERWAFKAGDWIESAPVIGDMDGDGEVEVVFGCADGFVYCLSNQGSVKWTFRTGKRVAASPTLSDCSLDGSLDILAASLNGNLYRLSVKGKWDPSRVPWASKRFDPAQTGCISPR